MSGRNFTLAVLDMAGTTIADNGIVERAVAAAMAEVAPGRPIDRAALRANRGASKLAMFEALIGTEAPRALAVFAAELHDMIEDGEVRPVPGAVEAIGSMRKAGLKVYLTTGLERSLVDAVVEKLAWQTVLDGTITAAEAGAGRPAPDLVFAAARAAGISDYSEVVVCGDTRNDALCGRNAGAGMTVGVLTGAGTPFDFGSVPGTVVVDSVADLPRLLGL